MQDITSLRKQADANEVNPRDIKARLARMITADFWNKEAADNAAAEFEKIFKHGKIPSDIPAVTVNRDRLKIIDLLSENNLVASRKEAKRTVQQGGVYLNDERIQDINTVVAFSAETEHILKIGKKRFYKIRKS
jgi:tyrosyl-tRNA synthetase